MRKLLLYIILVVILFSGFSELKGIWKDNQQSLDGTYEDVVEGVNKWVDTAKETGSQLKETLNEQIGAASEKYEEVKSDIEDVTSKIQEKRDQLEKTLAEIEEAKKALDELLDKEGSLKEEIDEKKQDLEEADAESAGENAEEN